MKSRVTWTLTVLSILLCGVHYWGLWLLAKTFAAGLVWWASLLMLLGPVSAISSLVVSLRPPRLLAPAVLRAVAVLFYVSIWALLALHPSPAHGS